MFVHLPTAQTCLNELRLFITKNLKEEKVLYPLFDSAISSSFLGQQEETSDPKNHVVDTCIPHN